MQVLTHILVVFICHCATHSRGANGVTGYVRPGEEKELVVNASYIWRPRISAVYVVCTTHIAASYYKIKCPLIDDSPFKLLSPNAVKYSIVNRKRLSTDHYSVERGFTRTSRRISWNKVKNVTNFECFCWGRSDMKSGGKQASVKVIHKECKNKAVFRRKINTKKNIHLSCCITGHPPLQVSWFKDKGRLSIPNEGTIIKNVRYQQKGNNLIISRTDVSGSGKYHCLAINSAGRAKGGNFRVILHENKTSKANASNEQIRKSTQLQESMTGKTNASNEQIRKRTQQLQDLDRSMTTQIANAEYHLFIPRSKWNEYEEDEGERKKNENKGSDLKVQGTIIAICTILVILCITIFAVYRRRRSSPGGSDGSQETTFDKESITSMVASGNRSFDFEDTKNFYADWLRSTTAQEATLDKESITSTLSSTPKLSSGLPTNSNTSSLLNVMNRVPAHADQRYFRSALIDHHGGIIILSGTGIKLVIPEGAIEVGTTEAVYLALLGNPDYIPKQENDSETLLTPVVMCGPHGLRFKKDVLLILPHCVAVSDEWKGTFQVLCSNTAPDAAPDWKTIFRDKEFHEDVFCNKREQNFSLFLRHFSWYTISGVGQARNFGIRVYHTTQHKPKADFKIRMYFIPILPKSTVAQEEVEKLEKQLKGTLGDGQKLKVFHKEGGDIKVEAYEISEGWKIISQPVQVEVYTELCNAQAASPNRTFRFKHVDPRPEGISCQFKVCQERCQYDTPADIGVSLNFEAERETERIDESCRSPNGRNTPLSSSGYIEYEESTTVFIPTRLRNDLIQLLDIEILGRHNWKTLAGRLGYKYQFIRWLERPNCRSPTDALLMDWESNVNESSEDALLCLKNHLAEMERDDCVDKIQEYLGKVESENEQLHNIN